ncbi:uncharacterized protein DUF4124 [Pseudoduganella lurida]|uniref:Uncharacterized protein DUF4124 n=1 Tax=Pseudoduganella lurida TaxID=1036180 RepID=A0A562RGC2_9BURK|nr:DUF4124 domain-containing protein [Pseudoduganella lurida]TWI67466.1 uncharacterized protein DUF4124 [Pseudoduganella lurida]
MNYRHWMIGTLLVACSTVAQAQWVWKDAKGVRQYSDQPPPASVPLSNVLKAPPGQLPDLRREMTGPSAAATPAAPAAKGKPTLAQRNEDYEKRRQEAAQTAQQAATEAQNKASEAANCQNARDNQRMLESGIRVATADANGERVFLDDAQKAAQLKRSRDIIAMSCK